MIPALLHARYCRTRRLLGGLAVSLALGASLAPARANDTSDFSEAEKLVFVEHQLANIKEPTSLHYTFVKSGSLEPGFDDKVVVNVMKVGATGSAVRADFLTGARKLELPQIENAQANPVILYFLEHDIREMARLTERKTGNYFRNRIRKSMVDEAQVRETTIAFEGRELPAREITLTPYETDPARVRYERYAKKRYTFVLAKGVPGGVYQMRTSMADAKPNEAPLLEEVMTFAGPAKPGAAAPTALNQPVKP